VRLVLVVDVSDVDLIVGWDGEADAAWRSIEARLTDVPGEGGVVYHPRVELISASASPVDLEG
jgi:hypothetical protein